MSNIHETINNAQEKAWSSVNCIDDGRLSAVPPEK